MSNLSDLKDCLDVAKPAVETASRLIEGLLGEPCKVLGGIAADTLLAWQWKNRIRITNRAKEIIDAEGIKVRKVEPSFLLPWLNSAGNFDAPELQEMWARLLASATSNAEHQHASLVNTLSLLSRDEAVLLDRLKGQEWFATKSPTGDFALKVSTREVSVDFHKDIATRLNQPKQLSLCVSHLCAIGLVADVSAPQGPALIPKSGNRPPQLTIPRSDNSVARILKLTNYGQRFLRICTKRETNIPE